MQCISMLEVHTQRKYKSAKPTQKESLGLWKTTYICLREWKCMSVSWQSGYKGTYMQSVTYDIFLIWKMKLRSRQGEVGREVDFCCNNAMPWLVSASETLQTCCRLLLKKLICAWPIMKQRGSCATLSCLLRLCNLWSLFKTVPKGTI